MAITTISFSTLSRRGLDNIGDGDSYSFDDLDGLPGSNQIRDRNFFAIVGDGDDLFEAGETAHKLGDSGYGDRVTQIVANATPSDPVEITAHGRINNGNIGDLTHAVRFSKNGFGLDNGPDGSLAKWLNSGDSLTFNTKSEPLAAIRFTAELQGDSGTGSVLVDIDSNVVRGADGTIAGRVKRKQEVEDALFEIDGLSDGDQIEIDFESRTILVNDFVVEADASALFDAFEDGPGNQVTLGSRSGTPVALNALSLDTGFTNQPPVAADDTFGTDEDTVLSDSVATNDSDPNDDVLTFTLLSNASNGSVVLNDDGSFDYTPNANFFGIDSFTYEVSDGSLTNTATADITVAPVNDAPTLAAGSGFVSEDGPGVDIDLAALGDDVDDDDNASTLNYEITGAPSRGVASINGATLTFDPGTDFQSLPQGTATPVTMEVTATDKHGATAVDFVTVDVIGGNDAPTLAPFSDTVSEDLNFSLLYNLAAFGDDIDDDDTGETLTYSISQAPSEGAVGIVTNLTPQPLLSFDLDGGFQDLALGESRDVSFDLTATDRHGASNTITATITVEGENEAPTLTAGTLDAAEDGPAVVLDLATLGDDVDSDDDGSTLTYTVTGDPAEGAATIDGTTLTFDPGADFQGLNFGETRDVFVEITAEDTHGATAINTVTIIVNGGDDAPGVQLTDVRNGFGGFSILGDRVDGTAGNLISSAGDVNGDGYEDVIVGGLIEDAVYVVFGKADGTQVDLAEVRQGIGGFLLAEGLFDAQSVSAAGDVNGDGLADIIIGLPNADPNPPDSTQIDWNFDRFINISDAKFLDFQLGLPRDENGRVVDSATDTGQALVVYGKENTQAIDLAAIEGGVGGFAINGYEIFAGAGRSVSSAGDINGDGLDDVVVGAPRAEAFDSVVNLLWENPYFPITNPLEQDGPDVAISDRQDSGKTYVIFGKTDTAAVELRDIDNDGAGGFAVYGLSEDRVGTAVTSLGDVNGDGFDDILITGSNFRTNSPIFTSAETNGIAYVVFGGKESDNLKIWSSQGPFELPYTFIDVYPQNLDEFPFTDVQKLLLRQTTLVEGFGQLRIIEPGEASFGRGLLSALSDKYDYEPYEGSISDENESVMYYMTQTPAYPSLSPLEEWQLYMLTVGPFRLSDEDGNPTGFSPAGWLNFDSIQTLVNNDFDFPDARVYDTLIFEPGETSSEIYLPDGRIDLADYLRISNPQVGDDGDRGYSIVATKDAFPFVNPNQISGIGDVNGDGLADMLVTLVEMEESAVIFGQEGIENVKISDVMAGNGGFIVSDALFDTKGAGDINGDGLDDFIATPINSPFAYVIYGKSNTTPVSLTDVTDGIGGFRIELSTNFLQVNGAGDVNGDGFDDLLVGAPVIDFGGENKGEAFVIFGGVAPGSAQVGDESANTLTGTANADVLIGGLGDDILIGGGGPDVLRGGAGNDVIGIGDLNFKDIDGGTGLDTVRFDFTNVNFEGAFFPETAFQGIERFDLDGDQNQITLRADDVLRMSNTSNTVRIVGEVDENALTLSGAGWRETGSVVDEALTFRVFESGLARVEVQDGLDVALRSNISLQDVAAGNSPRGLALLSPSLDAGAAVAGSDIDADGFADSFVFLPDPDDAGPEKGSIYIVTGSAGLPNLGTVNLEATASIIISGVPAGGVQGPQISRAGDINGDGREDIVYSTANAAYVVFGADDLDQSIAHSDIAAGIGGYEITGAGGTAGVRGLGDVNGDNLDDLLVQRFDSAVVVFGKADTTSQSLEELAADANTGGFEITNTPDFKAVGFNVSDAGDVNGDGLADVLIAAPFAGEAEAISPLLLNFAGAAFVVFGKDGGSSVDLSAIEAGPSDMGIAIAGNLDIEIGRIQDVAGGGDFNGDDFDDLVVNASGNLYVMFGGNDLASTDLVALGNGVGGFEIDRTTASIALSDVEFIGDLNGDGRDELALAAAYNSDRPEAGATYVIYGQQGAPDVDLLAIEQGITGFLLTDGIPNSVSGAGDVNGDGLDDLLLGVPNFQDENGFDFGASFVIFG